MVEQEAPESRLQTSVLLGGAVTMGAVLIASLVGQDPWGGAGLNWETLSAAATGAAVAAPLVAFREWTWSPKAREVLPAIQVRSGCGAGCRQYEHETVTGEQD